MKPGTCYTVEYTWLFSKIWLPKVRGREMKAKALLGVTLAVVETTTYSDYHEFNVDSKQTVAETK